MTEGERQESEGRAESGGLGSLVVRHGEGTAFVDADSEQGPPSPSIMGKRRTEFGSDPGLELCY